jgi:hypothetical protein
MVLAPTVHVKEVTSVDFLVVLLFAETMWTTFVKVMIAEINTLAEMAFVLMTPLNANHQSTTLPATLLQSTIAVLHVHSKTPRSVLLPVALLVVSLLDARQLYKPTAKPPTSAIQHAV